MEDRDNRRERTGDEIAGPGRAGTGSRRHFQC